MSLNTEYSQKTVFICTQEECNRVGSQGSTPQINLADIIPLLMTVPEAYRWNASSSTPYLTYKVNHFFFYSIVYNIHFH